MTMGRGIETPTRSPEEQVKITDLEKRFQIKVSEEDLQKYSDALFNLSEIKKIQEGQATVSEIAKLSLERLKGSINTQGVEKAQNKGREIFKKGEEALKKSGIEAQEFLEDSLNDANELASQSGNSEIGRKVKEVTQGGIEKAKELAAGAGFLATIKEWKNSDNFLLSFLGSLLVFFTGLFELNKKAEKVGKLKDKAETILNPESQVFKDTISQTSDFMVDYIEKSTGQELSEDTKQKLKYKLTPDNKGSYVTKEGFQTLYEKVVNGEKISFVDIQNLGVLEKLSQDSEMKEVLNNWIISLRQQALNKLAPAIKGSGVNLEGDNRTKFEKILEEEISNNKLTELLQRGEGTFLEGGLGIIDLGLLTPTVIFKCYKKDLIKAENLVIGASEYGAEKIKIGLRGLAGEDILPDIQGTISWDELDQNIEELSPTKKLLLERAFYAEMGLIAGVMGVGAYALTSGIVTAFEMGGKAQDVIKNGGTRDIFKNPKQLLTGPVERLEKTLNTLKPGSGVWLKDMAPALEEAQKSYKLVDQLKRATTQVEKDAILEKLGKIEQKVGRLSSKVSLGSPDLYKGATRNTLQTHYYRKVIKDLEQVVNTNNRLAVAIDGGNLSKYSLEAKKLFESFKIRYINGNAILRVSNNVEAKQLATALGKLTPEIAKGLLGKLPIIAMSTTMIDTFSEAKEESGLYEALLSTQGIYGGFMLLDEAKFDLHNGINIENLGAASAGILVLGTEAVLITKDMLRLIPKYGILEGVGRTTLNSAFRVPVEMVKLGGWSIARGNDILKVASSFLKKVPKKGKVGVAAALALGGVLATRQAFADDIDTNQLEADGYIKNGEPNLEKIGAEFAELDEDKKQSILDLSVISYLDKAFPDKQGDFSLNLTNGVYQIITTQENYQTSPNTFDAIEQEIGSLLNSSGSDIQLQFKST